MADTSENEAVQDSEEDQAEFRRMADVPAAYVDTWHLYTWSGHMRLTFGEIFGDLVGYRSALVLGLDDAEKLARQMIRIIERRKARRRSKEGGEEEAPAEES